MAAEPKRGCGYRKVGGYYLVSEGESFGCGRIPFKLEKCSRCDHLSPFSRIMQRLEGREVTHAAPRCEHHGSGSPMCESCPVRELNPPTPMGLLWVGEKHYSPEEFSKEAFGMGVSKRLNGPPPKWFRVGEHWVLLAHVKGISETCPPCQGEMVTPCLHEKLSIDDYVNYEEAAETGDYEKDKGRMVNECDECNEDGDRNCTNCDGTGKVHFRGVFFAFKPTRLEKIVTNLEPKEALEELRKEGITPVVVPHDDPDHNPGTDGGSK